MRISTELLSIIVCPVTGEKLEYDHEKSILINRNAGLAYPVIDGIPLLLETEAIKITEEA